MLESQSAEFTTLLKTGLPCLLLQSNLKLIHYNLHFSHPQLLRIYPDNITNQSVLLLNVPMRFCTEILAIFQSDVFPSTDGPGYTLL